MEPTPGTRGTVRLLVPAPQRAAGFAPNPPLLVAGTSLMTLGTACVWWIRSVGERSQPASTADPRALASLPFVGVLFFAAGWTLVGAGLRPRRSLGRGVALGVSLYVLTGLVWLIAFNLSLGEPVGRVAYNLVTQPQAALGLAVIWPLQLAQALGWFGLSIG